ncbi:thermoresistant gluconokinase [Pseudozyma hubeiensis SY62]|uniref:gluconokinase n=1 Tax=Pseudozyma hubeiensis (strain SY62) TaxID=1305764 RepID=R9PE43_PSEHS|nr:thermoresistant gluconokinase [Pseudozyma hubeiensis SY62]GAC99648.1 thermoresistant gluconokinase [Pseudozyma hubeiensis SY62]
MTTSSIPTLLIVMGTSGSGKSTVGSALSSALSCPFVDGDDLHPPSNVEKMSRGQPLNDADREPWLLRIRQTGLQLATSQTESPISPKKSEIGKVAEVLETSSTTKTSTDHVVATTRGQVGENEVKGPSKHLAVIACSSLKLIYRRLLRGTISSLQDPKALQSEQEQPKDLRVVHVYLDLTRELLEERMSNRKGHFMKLDMLYSQLDTLQVPDEEAEMGVVRVKVERQTTTDEIIADVVDKLKDKSVI